MATRQVHSCRPSRPRVGLTPAIAKLHESETNHHAVRTRLVWAGASAAALSAALGLAWWIGSPPMTTLTSEHLSPDVFVGPVAPGSKVPIERETLSPPPADGGTATDLSPGSSPRPQSPDDMGAKGNEGS